MSSLKRRLSKLIGLKEETLQGELYSNREFFIQQVCQLFFVFILPIIGGFLDNNMNNGMSCPVNFFFFLYLTGHFMWHVYHIRNTMLIKESKFRREIFMNKCRMVPSGVYVDLTNETLHMVEIYTNIIFTIFI